ncbi:ribosomal protein S18-alanine N-acetyltransferase [Alloacidobacterium dinghuense]|uniref:Ribosomal protein S18-alanine N-acetyltransferase n=1 Tax=Alloacidobacterium dinghuense TaxID=2763107 RepID=A0A7G8BJC3_9BACT|nr:ribosomal protein S18-alanine N-acetyltransferase [Alloacidobacterium dinghuense]QNI32643.1 ribosomal protein S18-alanine N-acetyltransferase [Alloacidobacterium dinghuense]
MSWIIRRMTANDIDGVLALEQSIPEAPHWSRIDYEPCAVADESAPLQRAGFVAEDGGRLLGFAVGKIIAGVCELESIAVTLETRSQGIGRALLEAVKNWAVANEAVRMELEVRLSNARAVKLYERGGLLPEGRRQAYYQSPEEDALLMGAALARGGKLI